MPKNICNICICQGESDLCVHKTYAISEPKHGLAICLLCLSWFAYPPLSVIWF